MKLGLIYARLRHKMNIHQKAHFARIFSNLLHFWLCKFKTLLNLNFNGMMMMMMMMMMILFSIGHSFNFCCFGNLCTIKFAICISKARLCGEICSTDVIMHKDYF